MSSCHLCHPEVMAGDIIMQCLLCHPSPPGQFHARFCFSLSATLHIAPGLMATASSSFHEKGEVREGRQDPSPESPFFPGLFIFTPFLSGFLNPEFLPLWADSGEWQSEVQIPPSPPRCPAPACRQPAGQPTGLSSCVRRVCQSFAALSCPHCWRASLVPSWSEQDARGKGWHLGCSH